MEVTELQHTGDTQPEIQKPETQGFELVEAESDSEHVTDLDKVTSKEPELVLVTEGEAHKDGEKLGPKGSEVAPGKDRDRSQDIGVVETEVGEFTLEGDNEFAKSSQISITERKEILVSKKMKEELPDSEKTDSDEPVTEEGKVSASGSEISEDWEMVEEQESDMDKDATDGKPDQPKVSKDEKDKPLKGKGVPEEDRREETESDTELSKNKESLKPKEVMEKSEDEPVVVEVPGDAFKDGVSDELKELEATEIIKVSDIEFKTQGDVTVHY